MALMVSKVVVLRCEGLDMRSDIGWVGVEHRVGKASSY